MAYTRAIAKQVDEKRAVIVFVGDSGEKERVLEMPIGEDKGAWVFDRLAELNAKQVIVTSKPVVEGEEITPTPRSSVPLTPQQEYEKARSIAVRDAQDIAAGIVDAGSAVVAANLQAAKDAREALDSTKG
jgi:hypothetical protein